MLIVEREGALLTLTLDRPKAANALAPELVEQMIAAFSDLTDVRLCVIRANGRHFCSGFDLSDLEDLSDGDLLWRFLRIEHLLQCVQHASVPVLALAQGQVVGAGADLFAACWQRVASSDAKFRMPGWNFELALGTRRITQLLGRQNASELLIDSQQLTATRAAQLGLVTQLAEQSDWKPIINEQLTSVEKLPAFSSARILELSQVDTREADIAAIVKTAGRPGLQERVLTYRNRVLATHKQAKLPVSSDFGAKNQIRE